MKIDANMEFIFPQSNKSGTKINSSVFIVATTVIWAIAFNFVLKVLKIQTAIIISESPIKIVNSLEWSSPNILATICSCLGARFRTLQKSPFAIQTVAIQ